jgi:hypothetical protein
MKRKTINFVLLMTFLFMSSAVMAQITSASLAPVNTLNISNDTAALSGSVVGNDTIYTYCECAVSLMGIFQPTSDTVLTVGAISSPQPISISASGLSGNTTYYCRLQTYVLTPWTIVYGNPSNIRSFTTLLDPQTPTSNSLSLVQPSPTSLEVNLDYICGNILTDYTVNCFNSSGALINSISVTLIGQGDTMILFTGLTPGMQYDFEAQGYNSIFFFGNLLEQSYSTLPPTVASGYFAGSPTVGKTTVTNSFAIIPGTNLSGTGYVELDSSGVILMASPVSTTAINDTFNFNFSGLTPESNYVLRLYAGNAGSTATLQQSVNIATLPLSAITILIDSVAEGQTSANVYGQVTNDTVLGYPLTLSYVVTQGSNVSPEVIHGINLYGTNSFVIPLIGLQAGLLYDVTVFAENAFGQVVDWYTFQMLPPNPNPTIVSAGFHSNPEIYSMSIPVTLTGSGPMDVEALSVYSTTLSTMLDQNLTVLTGVSSGLHNVLLGDYDPNQDIMVTLIVTDSVGSDTVTLNVFTQPGSNPTVNCWVDFVDTSFGYMTMVIESGGWEAEVQMFWYESGGTMYADNFNLGRSDTSMTLAFGPYDPETKVFVETILRTDEYGDITCNKDFTTDPLPDPIDTTGGPNPWPPITGIDDINVSEEVFVTSDGVIVVSEDVNVNITVQVSSMSGEMVLKQQLEVGQNSVGNDLPRGMYFCQFSYQEDGQMQAFYQKLLK